MKRLLALLLCLVMALSLIPAAAAEDIEIVDIEDPEETIVVAPENEVPNAGVAINSTNFPDKAFRDIVSDECDTDKNGVLSESEIAAVTKLYVSESGIASLKGVEYFTNLVILQCTNNQLTELDVTHCPDLQKLSCYHNDIHELDISKCYALCYAYHEICEDWQDGTLYYYYEEYDEEEGYVIDDGWLAVDPETVIIEAKPKILTQPEDQTIVSGSDVSFYVSAQYVDDYQWYWRTDSSSSWQKCTVSSADNDRLVYKGLTESKSGRQYRCKLTNSAGSVYTKAVTLTVTSAEKPKITTQPKDLSIAAGGDASFTVKATGVTSYQWYWRTDSSSSWQKSTVSTATTKTLVYKNLSESKSGRQYRCKLTNSVGSTYTKVVTLTVCTKPTITTQPSSKTVSAGTSVRFTVKATGNALSYQWYYRTSSAGEWKKCSGTGYNTATLTVEAKSYRNGYQYRCKVTNVAGYKYSSTVTLTVK